MPRPQIDEDIVNVNYVHGDNHVEYYVWKEKGKFDPTKPKKKGTEKYTGVCFSSLMSYIYKEDANRMHYKMENDPGVAEVAKTTGQQERRWIRLCIKHKLLPNYVTTDIIKGGMTLDISETTPSQLYMYLCALRYIREEPGFVKSVLHLVREHRMNFFAAFVLASKVAIEGGGHHILDVTKNMSDFYGGKTVNDLEQVPLHYMVGLYRYTQNPYKYDKRDITANGSFNMNTTISKICEVRHGFATAALLKPGIRNVIGSKSDKTVEKRLKEFSKSI